MGKKIVLLSLVVLLGAMFILTCGGDNSEIRSKAGSAEIRLTRQKLEKYVGFHQDWFEKIKDDVSDFESKGDLQDFGKAIRYGKKSEKELQRILKKNGLDMDEFKAIDETFSTIMQAVIQEDFLTGQSSFSANFGDEGIAEMENLLDDPNISKEQKEMIREQLKELQKNQAEMRREKTRAQAELDDFDPHNVALVREYIPKVWGIYGGPGNLPE